jgi:hypothetical protein
MHRLTTLPTRTTINRMPTLADRLRHTSVELRPFDGGPFRTVKYVVLFSNQHHIPHTADVYAVRPVPADICRRIAHARPDFGMTHIQVEICDNLGRRWINVPKDELVHATPRPKPNPTAKTDRLPAVR